MQEDTDAPVPGEAQVKTQRWSVSLVWIVPVVALLIGASLVVRNWMQEGPVISITFKTGQGLEAHKTQVKYRNVVIGEVTAVELAADKKSVSAKVQLNKEAESFATRDSVFWVVRPRIGAGGVSGVDTLFSGNFIGADAGQSGERAKTFTGLESPPAITYGEQGKSFHLHARDLGSLDIGSPVYFRKIPVGQVVSYALDPQGKGVDIGIFVLAPNDAFVTQDTRFWNASGVDVAFGADGIKVNTQSLSSILIGGVAFGLPERSTVDQPAAEKASFELFADEQSALAPPDGLAQYFRLRFDESLRGLKPGAPVEFMGMEVGKVLSVQLDFDIKTRTFPVIVDAVLFPQRIGPAHQKMIDELKHVPSNQEATSRLLANFVEHGLRAQPRTGNLLTGQLYISLDFYPDAAKVDFDPSLRPFRLPTIPGSLDKLQDEVQKVIDKINKLPLESIASNLNGNLVEMRKGLKHFNDQTLPGVQATLDDLRKTLQSANTTLDEGSPQREQVSQTLRELERMSRSLRELSDYLSRHPESLLRGRPQNAESTNLQPRSSN